MAVQEGGQGAPSSKRSIWAAVLLLLVAILLYWFWSQRKPQHIEGTGGYIPIAGVSTPDNTALAVLTGKATFENEGPSGSSDRMTICAIPDSDYSSGNELIQMGLQDGNASDYPPPHAINVQPVNNRTGRNEQAWTYDAKGLTSGTSYRMVITVTETNSGTSGGFNMQHKYSPAFKYTH
jgi:hypothetical protein